MKKVSLLFGIHMHQPVDNFGDAVDEAVTLCYAPFFETMLKYPNFKFAVHCSGWLLDQIKNNHPDIFSNMQKLTDCGAIEWISAGYYEPVLSSIPSEDRQAQIVKLNAYVKEHLKMKPKGLWLTERVWESSIVPDLHSSAIDYALVDDYHFLSSGFNASKMDGYYETEEGGCRLALFPISQSLRYALPFFNVNQAIKSILECSKKEDSAAIIFDDAEKFGLWPETHEWVYEKGWLKDFIEAVLKHEEIEVEHYSEYLKRNKSRGLAYLNNTSYVEMGEWSFSGEQSLALEALKQHLGDEYFKHTGIAFIKGGIWKNFFIKYHESNYLHKRMLYHSLRQKNLKESTKESLYKLQTNDVFWHGVFGGLYLPNLRDNAYRYLLEIERDYAKENIVYEHIDIDINGYDDLKVLTPSISSVFSRYCGGQMIEFGSLDVLFNWQNTLMRRREAYHEKILYPKQTPVEDKTNSDDSISTIHSSCDKNYDNLISELIYDWHPKYSFIDHFSITPFNLDNFKNVTFDEIGDFVNQPFELDKDTNTFTRNGGVYLDENHETSLNKQYSFENEKIILDLTCNTQYNNELYYAMEFNLHFAHPHLAIINGNVVGDGLMLSNVDEIVIIDTYTNKKITLTSSEKCTFNAYILKTISQSESGFDAVSQQISFIFSLAFKSKLNMQMHLGVSDV